MKGNILETMKELGAAMDDGVELEVGFLVAGKSQLQWDSTNQHSRVLGVWKQAVEKGRIRTRPHTVEVRLYKFGDAILAYTKDQEGWTRDATANIDYKTHTIPLDGE